MTYYTADQGGARGANGKTLDPFKSVAVPIAMFRKKNGKMAEIKGVGIVRVDDACAGGACKDFDIYIGGDIKAQTRLPNWQAGNIPIEYRWL